MRKYIKRELCNIIEQLAKVNETLITNGHGISQEQVQSVLVDCQQGAVAIGNKVEECEGEGTEAICLLEDYCEKAYLLYINWMDVNVREKELKRVSSLLNKVKSTILYDIKDSKKEVVFLPYKASMWDSLESVWKAADEDPDCNAYVVPIPYYDKNPDGSLGAMYYEGAEIAKIVPILDWKKVDLEKMHPDAIVYHNPYDSGNYITSIHPDYYSAKIKTYTELMVYIPYFVSIGSGTELFCTATGVLWADKVYVASQVVKDTYRNAFEELADMKIEKLIDINKVVVAGSPKVDRILRYAEKVELCDICEKWRSIIYNDKKKTVILFNTSIGDLLKYNDIYLERMKETFEYFYNNKECALWWRPHPLLKSTLNAMRPQLYDKYLLLENYFIEKEIGIYDDTSDVDRAIAMADAYYGVESSSLVTMFGLTGKPILIQSFSELYDESFDSVFSFHDCVEYEGHIYFSSANTNGLFKANLETEMVEFVGRFFGEDIFKRDLHLKTLLIGKEIWFIPYNAERISIYNLEEKVFSQIDINQGSTNEKYVMANYTSDKIYLIPFKSNELIEIDLRTHELVVREQWMNEIKKLCEIQDDNAFVRNGSCICDNKLYMAPVSADALVEVDLCTSEVFIYECPFEVKGFQEIVRIKEQLVLLPKYSGKIFIWDFKQKEFELLADVLFEEKGLGVPFISAAVKGDEIILLPAAMEEGLRINIDTKEAQSIAFFGQKDYKKYPGNWRGAYNFVKVLNDGKIISISRYDNSLVIYDNEQDSGNRIQLRIPTENQKQFMMRDLNVHNKPHHFRMAENYKNMIGNFCKYVAKGKVNKKQKQLFLDLFYHEDGKSSGQVIWEDIVKNIS